MIEYKTTSHDVDEAVTAPVSEDGTLASPWKGGYVAPTVLITGEHYCPVIRVFHHWFRENPRGSGP